jgi:hypothetical protein
MRQDYIKSRILVKLATVSTKLLAGQYLGLQAAVADDTLAGPESAPKLSNK